MAKKPYMIIARVNGIDYLTRCEANNFYEAEHIILDVGTCGRHEYGVENCTAYDRDTMKSSCFIMDALKADRMVDLDTLLDIIDKNNDRIRRADQRENTRDEVEKLKKRIHELEQLLKEEV